MIVRCVGGGSVPGYKNIWYSAVENGRTGRQFLFFRTTIATMMAMTIMRMRKMKKQIHRFLRAARAESTALFV